MIFKELLLTSFGKYKNKSLILEDGINIIYGDNEAGKTTIHKFTEGMLFGFFKPYSKRRMYSDDYDRFFPWDYTDYSGVLKYSIDDDTYRIERNFIRGNDEVRILDDKTGEDISHLFEYDNVTRLHQPMSAHMGLNSIVFNNTVSISQLGTKAEDALAKEVKDSLINLGGSLDEDISIKKVIDRLDKKIDEIGTKGRIKTSPYGKVVEQIEILKSERKKAISVLTEVREYQEKTNALSEKINELNMEKNQIENSINMLEGYQAKQRYIEGNKLIDEVNLLEKQVEEQRGFSLLDYDDYAETIKLEHLNKSLNEDKEVLKDRQNKESIKQKKIKGLVSESSYFEDVDKEEIDQLTVYFNIMEQRKQDLDLIYKKIAGNTTVRVPVNDDNINEKLYVYEEMEDEKNSLFYNSELNNVMFLNTRIEEKQRSLKRMNLVKAISIIGILASLALGVTISPVLYFITGIPVILMTYLTFSSRELKEYIEKLNKQVAEIEKKENERKERIYGLEKDMLDILISYSCKTKAELRRLANEASQKNDRTIDIEELKNKKISLIEEIQIIEDSIKKYLILIKEDVVSAENIKKLKTEYNRYLELKKQDIELEKVVDDIIKEIKGIDTRQKDIDNNIKEIFTRYNVTSIDTFKQGLEKKKNYERALQLLESKKSLLSNILGDNSIDFLKKKSQEFTDVVEQDVRGLVKEILLDKLKKMNDNISKIKEELTRLEEKIRYINSSTTELVQIEEELIRKNSIKEEYDEKITSLELAKNTIDKISRNIQRDFAPRLNSEVGKIIRKVTAEKYQDVKITENLDIKVVDPYNNKLVDIERLSGGTIDQLYFAMRFSIIDIIKEDNKLPLILDDCFIQYDHNRLRNILEFLYKESLNRQVILFTCHKREKEILKEMNANFNLINL